MKKALVLGVTIMGAFLLLVGGCARQGQQGYGKKFEEPQRQVVTADLNGVILRLSIEDSTFKIGEAVPVEVSAENTGDRPASYTVGAIGYPAPLVLVNTGNPAERVELLEPENRDRMWAEALETRELRPGQKISRRLSWDQKTFLSGKETQVSSGIYRITAMIGLGDGSREEVSPLEASLEVTIKKR